ncbi:ABC transporter permease [Stomatohabitans albus]|uniref:ABC transporter permease n=1 Tax=Stomatohabitans albus TaxID=3110766 RepID=UPI00300D4B15
MKRLKQSKGTVGSVTDLAQPEHSRWKVWLDQAGLSIAAVVIALGIGAVLIAATNLEVQRASGYFFARPTDTLMAIWHSVADAYVSMFRGSVFDFNAPNWQRAIRPFTETLVFATPLICAGLGLSVGFRAGLFNIGAQGQMLMGAALGGYVGFAIPMPAGVHLIAALLGAILGGAIWAGIAGVLKAQTGANEVIVTIMLNSVALFLLSWLLTLPTFLVPGSTNPQSPPVLEGAQFPALIGPPFRLHAGFLVALLATAVVWWLIERSTIGFEIRAVGHNMEAARFAGMSVGMVTIRTMMISGALAGLAAGTLILGTESRLESGIAGSIGFDAITVALLGRNRPVGTALAGVLFGALKAGGFLMQTAANTPIDIVLVLQSVIVLLIAAPALVRAAIPFMRAEKKS